MLSFGERVRTLRKERGVSLRELSRKLKIDAGYLSRVERDLVPPSKKLIYLLANEFQTLGLFLLAGRRIPPDFSPDTSGPGSEKAFLKAIEKIEQKGSDLRKFYPEHDPYFDYAPDFPGILELNQDEIEYLAALGVKPEDIYIFPPLRKRLIDLAGLLVSTYEEVPDKSELDRLINKLDPNDKERIHEFINTLSRYQHLLGLKEGIEESLKILKRIQEEKGDFYLLAAFYEPETARIISGFLEMLEKFHTDRIKKQK